MPIIECRQVEKEGDAASCGHPNTGSTRTFVESFGDDRTGITRVVVDSAGGMIIGPGTQNVFVENERISLPQDAIVGHDIPPHAAPVTRVPDGRSVWAATGFISEGGTGEDVDLESLMSTELFNVYASGLGHYPPQSYQEMQYAWQWCCWSQQQYLQGCANVPPGYGEDPSTWGAFDPLFYTVTNVGTDPTPNAFNIGFFKVPGNYPLTLPRHPDIDWTESGAELLAETRVFATLQPGQSYQGSFDLADLTDENGNPYTLEVGAHYFQVYPDLDLEITEHHGDPDPSGDDEISSESNAPPVVTEVVVNVGCHEGGPTELPPPPPPPDPV